MATKEQCDFFRALYEEEASRYRDLGDRAKLYLTVITAFVATLTLKADDVQKSALALRIPWVLVLVIGGLVAIALFLTAAATMVRRYEGAVDAQGLLDQFIASNRPPTNEDFFDGRIVDYAVAAEVNSRINNQTGALLTAAGLVLAAALLGLIVMFCMALSRH